MPILLVARTAVCTEIVEFLNTFGQTINWYHSGVGYFGDREVAMFCIEAPMIDVDSIVGYMTSRFSSDSVFISTMVEEDVIHD